jgi:hypothetical protein
MNREEAISLMNDVVNHINREVGKNNNMSEDQINEAIDQHQEGLTYINGMLYDELYHRGVISQF